VNQDAAIDARVGSHFGVTAAPFISVRPVGDALFSVTHLQRLARTDRPDAIYLPAQPAYFMMLYLRDTEHCDIVAGGVETAVRCFRTGSVCLIDLDNGAAIRLQSDIDALAFHLPYALFSEVGTIPRAPEASPLRCLRGSGDRIMWNIACALLPLFGRNDAGIDSVLRPMAIAVCIHLMQHYEQRRQSIGRALLTPWQEKDIKEFMADHLQDNLTIAEVASKVDMSTSDFTGAFSSTVGITPRQWLSLLRVNLAKDYLGNRARPVSEVARQCGFDDESEFNDEFLKQTGATPAGWRQGLFA
jgi:AraC family transcriptional regulator